MPGPCQPGLMDLSLVTLGFEGASLSVQIAEETRHKFISQLIMTSQEGHALS